MTDAELVEYAIKGLQLPYDERVAKLAGMPNRALAQKLDSWMNELLTMRAVFIFAQEQGYAEKLAAFLLEGAADERQAA